MIRPIKLTEALIEDCVAEFRKNITEARMFSGELSYKQTFKWEGKVPPAHIVFSNAAYLKMCTLIKSFESEVAWHCTVERDTERPEVFHVLDVFVSPQEVTGATVNSDQQKYEMWLCSLEDEVFNKLHMQCHSHVNMGVSPSSTDKTHWSDVLNALVDDGDVFYIFMIWNKRMEYTVQVYDMHTNTYYDGKDVEIELEDSGLDLGKFLSDAKAVVTTKSFTYQGANKGGGSYYTGKVQSGGYGQDKTKKGEVKTLPEAKSTYASGAKSREEEIKKRKEEKRSQYRGTTSGTGFFDEDGYFEDDGGYYYNGHYYSGDYLGR